MCDLAEWGIVVDSEVEVKKMLDDYFFPMWKNSFTGEDVNVDEVMDGLNVDRDGEDIGMLGLHNVDTAQHMMPHGTGADYYDVEEDGDDVMFSTPPGLCACDEAKDEAHEADTLAPAEEENDGTGPTETDEVVTNLSQEKEDSGKSEVASPDSEEPPKAGVVGESEERDSLAALATATLPDLAENTAPTSPPGLVPIFTSPTLTSNNDEEALEQTAPSDKGNVTTTAVVVNPSKPAETEQRDDSANQGRGSPKQNVLNLDFCGFAESLRIGSD